MNAIPVLGTLLFALTLITASLTPCSLAGDAPGFSEPRILGTVNVPGLEEASGLAASRNQSGVFWSHNDKGGGAEIFAFAGDGRPLGRYALTGAASIDYEDITIGSGIAEGVDYLYVADIGDGNKAPVRESVQVYCFPEPVVVPEQYESPVDIEIGDLITYTLRYPDGPRNAETLMLDPLTGDLIVISQAKAPDKAGIYRAGRRDLQTAASGGITMSRDGDLAFDVANSGDISPAGNEILIRQERFAQLWKRAPGQSIAAALAATPLDIPIVGKPVEKNGEAICFDPQGSGYYTLSDSSATQPLYYFERVSGFVAAIPPRVTGMVRLESGMIDVTVAPGGATRLLVLEYSADFDDWIELDSIVPAAGNESVFRYQPEAGVARGFLRVRAE